jgi:hypothetical protein
MQVPRLTDEQAQLLRETVIEAERPGPVLHDFQMLLDFVGQEGCKAAGKYNLLPIDAIDELDQRLSRPLRLSLQRPQLRSHPYLQGLHLLLRSSGLTRVVGSGARTRLVVDAVLRDQWDQLNPTERYFNLLEAWLRFGRPEMVGEHRSWLDDMLLSCLQAWREIPAKGKRLELNQPESVYLFGIGRNFYQLALMDLFGFVEVLRPTRPVKPWCPAGIKHLPFGDAILSLLAEHCLSDLLGSRRAEEEEEPDGFGAWQPLFQSYFPDWRRNLEIATPAPHEGVFVFRVSLWDCWRRIAVRAENTLDDLMNWILRSVKFDLDHLYCFTYRDQFGATVRAMGPETDEDLSTAEVRIGELPLEPGQSMSLVYDFGDNWEFDVKLERIEPPGKIKAPRILERHGKPPRQYPHSDW